MNAKDKEYIDRQYNQLNNELANLKNYLQDVAPSGPAKVELDRSEIYSALLQACHDCLEQREARRQEIERREIEKIRADLEAKGLPFYANENEWRAAVYLDDKQSREHLLAIARSIDSRYKTLTQTLAHLTSLLTNTASPTSSSSSNATHPASSNASSNATRNSTNPPSPNDRSSTVPSDRNGDPCRRQSEAPVRAKPHLSLMHRHHAYLSGNFTLPRSYTLLTIYLSLLFLLLFY